MKRLKVIGLALVAVLAMSAVIASAASAALPEFEGPFPNKFTSTSGAGKLETVAGRTVKCTADSNTGSITGAKTDTAKVIFTGCESLGAKCSTAGAAAGEIKTVELESTLGYINKATKEVGIDLKPKSGKNFAEFVCATIFGNQTLVVEGSVVGVLTPINTKTKTYTLTFKQEKGVQKPTKLEGAAEDVLKTEGKGLENFAFEQSGEETTDTLTTEKETKVNA